MPFAQRICTCSLIKRNGNGRSPDWTWSLWRRVCAIVGETVLAYQTSGSHERALDYYGPELFPQRGCCIYQKTVQSHSTQVDAACIRELWLLENGRFVEVSGVTTKYRSAYERFSTCYRTVTISSRAGTGRAIRQRRLPMPLRTSTTIPLTGCPEFSMKFEPRHN